MSDKTVFIRQTAPALFAQLAADTPPRWGKMSAQHMIEHLSGVFYLAWHPEKGYCVNEGAALEKALAFLWSDRAFRQNTKAPGLPDEPLPLRFADLDTALAQLLRNIDAFYAFFEAAPDRGSLHPVFGMLDLAGWEQFHDKHLRHHLTQFGLLEEAA
ncbi:MAG: hypothetical protein OHK0039_39180 [Bacteroidia bacterium]